MKKLFIIDGYGLLFRSFYGVPLLYTSENIPVNAIYGMSKFLFEVYPKIKNNSVVFALDGGGTTFRENIYSEYKQNRGEAPDELLPQFDIFNELLECFGVSGFRINGYEADDIIASYVKIAKKNNFASVIYSSDKDLMQLLDDDVEYWNVASSKSVSNEDVVAKFGIEPKFLIDYFSLVGDASDNIPGVKSIGSKTAASLIKQFGTLTNIYDNLENVVPAKVKSALENDKDNAFLSYKLFSLHSDIENLPFIDNLFFEDVNFENLKKFFEKYEMKSFVRKINSIMNMQNGSSSENLDASFEESVVVKKHNKKNDQASFDF